MIDRARCTALLEDAMFGGPRCQELATHDSFVGHRCARHAEELRRALRSPNTLINIRRGPRSESEIAQMVVELSSVPAPK
jgi:hypothetical protein